MDITTMVGAASLLGGGYEPTTYMIKFAKDGTRESTIPCGRSMTTEEKQELISQGYLEIPAEEWQEYCSGKIRGKDGTPVDPPPYVPTKEERLAALDSQYQADVEELAKYFGEAGLKSDTETQTELQAELAEINATYVAERKAIEEG
jgi:hypothetical protein